jgi:peptidyl-prolyl cis-trans isomerase C
MRFSCIFALVLPCVCLAQTPAAKPRPAAAATTQKKAASAPKPAAAKPAAAKPAPAPQGKPVLTVGDESLTAEQFDALVELLPEQYKAQVRGPGKRNFAEQIVRLKILNQEALRRNLDKDPKVVGQIEFQRANVLAGAMVQQLAAEKINDPEAVRKYYDDHKSEYELVKARHILIRMQGSQVPLGAGKKELSDAEALAKANEIKKQLDGGASFDELAKKESDDTGSGANGGDLGEFRHHQMVPPFEAAAFALPVGQVSDPVKTQFGYHIIRVDSHKIRQFDEVKEEIGKRVGPEYAQRLIEEMRKTAHVELDEAFFPVAPPPMAPGQMRPGTPAPPPAPAK